MSNRITAIAASALAFAFGCEQPIDRVGQEEPTQQEQIAPEDQQQQGFNQGPEDQQRQQAERQRQQQQQQQQARAGQGQGQQSPGQVVKQHSDNNMNRTISQLNRQLRQNDMDVVATVRYDERMRQRAMREGGEAQQGGQAQQSGSEIGDVRMLLFRDTQQEARAIESEGPESLLKAPRALLVYEQGEDVIVSYQMPEAMAATGSEEPTTERLQRIVQESTQSRQRGQQQAQREEQQQEQQASRQQQQAQREEQQAQGEERTAQREEQQASREQQQASREEQQAQREQQEQQRQARAGQQREQGQAMN